VKISILCANLSRNCLGRSYILAKMLMSRWPVEIVGPMFGEKIWFPLSDDSEITYKYVKVKDSADFLLKVKKIIGLVTGDVVFANKPLLTSFGLGLIWKMMNKKPLVLDIDDWELGFSLENYKSLTVLQKAKNLIWSTWNYSYYWNILFMEKLTKVCKEKTVSNSFLQKKFGGVIIKHARDTSRLDPVLFNAKELKSKYGLSGKKIISFIGSRRDHKGIDDLIEAIKQVENKDLVFMLVGVETKKDPAVVLAEQQLGINRAAIFGEELFSKIGEFLAISDVVVVPQADRPAAKGQFPAKIFDAMAMAKPIISTAVNDVPEVVGDCGIVVTPGDVGAIAENIKDLLKHEEKALNLGLRAREKCIREYSYKVITPKLISIFKKFDNIDNE